MIDNNKYLIVIPFLASEAQGRELEYAIAGWRMHFKAPYHIAIVGDDPQISGNDITWIDCPRVKPIEGQYTCHLDFVNKFQAARSTFPETRGFIFACDDYYAINDFTIKDVMVLKCCNGEIQARHDSPNPWRRDKARTKDLLLKLGYPVLNRTTHLPQWYDWDWLAALWIRFGMADTSYVMEDLYYNIYFCGCPSVDVYDVPSNMENIYLRGVYRPDPNVGKIKEAFNDKIWINNSKEGWCPALEEVLKEHYGI